MKTNLSIQTQKKRTSRVARLECPCHLEITIDSTLTWKKTSFLQTQENI